MPLKGYKQTEEHKRKISEIVKKWHKEVGLSFETRQKISLAHKGKPSGMLGKHFPCSEETKIKIGLANSIALKGIKHSQERNIKKSLAMIGEKHWNWGGISPNRGKPMSEEQKEKIKASNLKRWEGKEKKSKRSHHPDSSDYKKWRKTIFERDNYTCQKCQTKGGYLQAHHIKSWIEFLELRFEVSNGTTLCKNCHQEIHKRKLSL